MNRKHPWISIQGITPPKAEDLGYFKAVPARGLQATYNWFILQMRTC